MDDAVIVEGSFLSMMVGSSAGNFRFRDLRFSLEAGGGGTCSCCCCCCSS